MSQSDNNRCAQSQSGTPWASLVYSAPCLCLSGLSWVYPSPSPLPPFSVSISRALNPTFHQVSLLNSKVPSTDPDLHAPLLAHSTTPLPPTQTLPRHSPEGGGERRHTSGQCRMPGSLGPILFTSPLPHAHRQEHKGWLFLVCTHRPHRPGQGGDISYILFSEDATHATHTALLLQGSAFPHIPTGGKSFQGLTFLLSPSSSCPEARERAPARLSSPLSSQLPALAAGTGAPVDLG